MRVSNGWRLINNSDLPAPHLPDGPLGPDRGGASGARARERKPHVNALINAGLFKPNGKPK